MVMKIQVLGSGCKKCKNLYDNVERAVKEMGLDCEIEKVEDMQMITSMGVMMTPAIVIDGEIKSFGKLLSSDEIKESLLK